MWPMLAKPKVKRGSVSIKNTSTLIIATLRIECFLQSAPLAKAGVTHLIASKDFQLRRHHALMVAPSCAGILLIGL